MNFKLYNKKIMCDFVKVVVLPGVVLIALYIYAVDNYEGYLCRNYTKITGIETKRELYDECYIKTDKGFRRWDEYKNIIIASERPTEH